MKTRRSSEQTAAVAVPAGAPGPALPARDELAAFKAWFEGLSAREAVTRYLSQVKADGQSSRGMLGSIRRRLVAAAIGRRRDDLAAVIAAAERDRLRPSPRVAARLAEAMDAVVRAPVALPAVTDPVSAWFSPRIAIPLRAHGISTLADLTVRVPRRKMWWQDIPRLGATGAHSVEAFFAGWPELTERARALVTVNTVQDVVPWERLQAPENLNGSRGQFRAPVASCALSARNDHEAVTAWLDRQESAATLRAYRKEAERLILWAILERGKPMSSLTAEDATAYRTFLRRPTPHLRWVGPPRPRSAPDWRPFAGALAPTSVAYTLTVVGAMYRWLVEQRYLLVNPFAGLKVRGGTRTSALDASRSFTQGEWQLVRTIADGLEWSYGWDEPAAQRLRFLLDFCYATGLRASEFVGAVLANIEVLHDHEWWLSVDGKGGKLGRVSIPPLAQSALERYLVQRHLPVSRAKWNPKTRLVGRVDTADEGAITPARLWAVLRRFFETAKAVIGDDNPALATKLRRASPHWMRHTHATHGLDAGADITTVRDNLRHASITTTSAYLHTDDSRRARQLASAFKAPG